MLLLLLLLVLVLLLLVLRLHRQMLESFPKWFFSFSFYCYIRCICKSYRIELKERALDPLVRVHGHVSAISFVLSVVAGLVVPTTGFSFSQPLTRHTWARDPRDCRLPSLLRIGPSLPHLASQSSTTHPQRPRWFMAPLPLQAEMPSTSYPDALHRAPPNDPRFLQPRPSSSQWDFRRSEHSPVTSWTKPIDPSFQDWRRATSSHPRTSARICGGCLPLWKLTQV